MRLTSAPEALPGACYLCGSGSRALYVDLGRDVEFHGAMYLCVDECLREIKNMFDWRTPEECELILEDNKRLHEANFQFLKRIAGLERLLDGYRALDLYVEPSELPVSGHPVGVSQLDREASREFSEEPESVGTGEERPSEQASDEDLDGLRAVESKPESEFTLNL